MQIWKMQVWENANLEICKIGKMQIGKNTNFGKMQIWKIEIWKKANQEKNRDR